MKSSIKLLVLDEVHKMFDRTSKFRTCYDSFKMLKDEFEGISIMAPATLDDSQLVDLAKNYLQTPVLIKGSFNKKNKKITVESCKMSTKKMGMICGMR